VKQNIKKELLNQEYLKKILHYDPLTGIFTWKERPVELFKPGKYQLNTCNSWNTRCAGKKAGSIWTPKDRKTSYIEISISLSGKTKLYKAHRLAILYTEGHFPAEQVDHIDGDGTNNKRNNLREVTALENRKNMPMYSNNTSGYVGVSWFKRDQKWKVKIKVNGRQIYGGLFINIEDAIAKRKELEVQYKFHLNHGRGTIE
jgi:hypothetical protein